MSSPTSVRSSSPLGEKLLCLLKSGEVIHNPLKLLPRNSEVAKLVHRDVFEATSEYVRRILSTKPGTEQPIPVPFADHILDLIIEFVYTTRAVTVEIEDAVELFAAASQFELDDLIGQLTKFLRGNMAECIEREGFLSEQSYEHVACLTALFPMPLAERDQIKLIRSIYTWASRQSIEGYRISELISHVVTESPSDTDSQTSVSGSAKSSPPPDTVSPSCLTIPLHTAKQRAGRTTLVVAAKDKAFQIVDGAMIDRDFSPCLLAKIGRTCVGGSCITDNKLFVTSPRSIDVFNLTSGVRLRSLEVPPSWASTYKGRLTVKNGRVYTWHECRVHEVTNGTFYRLCRTPSNIENLRVISHDGDTLRFCYRSSSQVSLMTIKGTVIEEVSALSQIRFVVGTHEDLIIGSGITGSEIVVIRENSVIRAIPVGLWPICSCGPTVYLKDGKQLYSIDIETASVTPLSTVSRVRYIVMEEMD